MYKKYRLRLEDGFEFEFEAVDLTAAYRISFRVERDRQKKIVGEVQEVAQYENCAV